MKTISSRGAGSLSDIQAGLACDSLCLIDGSSENIVFMKRQITASAPSRASSLSCHERAIAIHKRIEAKRERGLPLQEKRARRMINLPSFLLFRKESSPAESVEHSLELDRRPLLGVLLFWGFIFLACLVALVGALHFTRTH